MIDCCGFLTVATKADMQVFDPKQGGGMVVSCQRLSGVKRIADCFANENEQRQHKRNGEEARQPQPWGLQVGFALGQ